MLTHLCQGHWLRLAERHLTRPLFGGMLQRARTFPGVACPPDAKPPPSGAAETPWTKIALNLVEKDRLVYKAS
jgi:hypothetical protein